MKVRTMSSCNNCFVITMGPLIMAKIKIGQQSNKHFKHSEMSSELEGYLWMVSWLDGRIWTEISSGVQYFNYHIYYTCLNHIIEKKILILFFNVLTVKNTLSSLEDKIVPYHYVSKTELRHSVWSWGNMRMRMHILS